MCQLGLEIFQFIVMNLVIFPPYKLGRRHFLNFKSRYRLKEVKYDIIAGPPKAMEKLKRNIMISSSLICFKFYRFIKLVNTIQLVSKSVDMANKMRTMAFW